MMLKGNKYKLNDHVSFERRTLLGPVLTKGVIVSCKYLNYRWSYLVECDGDKKMIVVAEEEIWLLDGP